MNYTPRYLLRQTFPAFVYREFKNRYKKTRAKAELEGVELDIEGLDDLMKTVILKATYEAPEVVICKQLIEPSDRILECGAAIGFVGLFCLKTLRVSKMVSVEANPGTVARLRRNYALNALQPNVI